MSPERVFVIANTLAALAWLLLAVAPRSRWSGVVSGELAPALFAGLYVAIVVSLAGGMEGGFSTLPDVATFFGNPWLLLAGWLHYLAFDLLIGVWEVRDAQERGIPHALVVPCLLLTFLFGPGGWLLYAALRARYASRFGLEGSPHPR